MSDLTYREAAEYLGVSTATIQNWTRQGLLSNNPARELSKKELIAFGKKLKTGKAGRLRSRANKRLANRTFLPDEYIESPGGRRKMTSLAPLLRQLDHTPQEILFSWFVLRIAKSEFSARKNRFGDNAIGKEMESWYEELGKPELDGLLEKLDILSLPEQKDTAGLIYQILQKEGRKSLKGSYYTPPEIARSILDQYKGKWNSFLDPCCGSGIFLLIAASQIDDPLAVEGWDSDPLAVHLARLNLMLAFPHRDFSPKIYCRNSLSGKNSGCFDLIATNPPWGHHFSKEDLGRLNSRYRGLSSGESFSFFLRSGMELLSERGILSYLLPESILKVKTHRDIRRIILDNYNIRSVSYLGKPFRNVQTEVIRIDLECRKAEKPAIVQKNGDTYPVDQERFRKNLHYLFDFNCNDRDYRIFDKVNRRNHYTLSGKATWILGVVSGNNKKFLHKGNREGYEPILSGREISPFSVRTPAKSIRLDRNILQQCAPIEHYKLAPRIVYRFITGTPVFAIDREGLVTLNSANSLYPEKGVSPEVIAFFFNSSLYRFILGKKFNSLKILRDHLEQLPLPHLTAEEEHSVKEFVADAEKCAAGELSSLQANMDQWVFNFFEISHSDKKYVVENL